MIGRITGTIVDHDLQQLLVDVGGVAYEIEVPLSTAYELAESQGPVIIHTHLVVREDAQLLFGFATKDDRELFRLLIKVKGLGPKLALAVLSSFDIKGLNSSLALSDDFRCDIGAVKTFRGVDFLLIRFVHVIYF